MNTAIKTRAEVLKATFNDDFVGEEREVEIRSHGVLVMTIHIVSGYVDVTNELNGVRYNLMEIAETGIVLNDEPKLD